MCSGRRPSIEAALRRNPDCGFGIYFVKHGLEFLILIYVCIKSDVTNLETIII